MRARLKVVTVVGVVVLAATGCARPPTPVLATGEACTGTLPGEGRQPPPLPVHRPVGPGVLIYRPCQTCGAWLLTEDGQRYDIPPVPRLPGATSPDPDASPLTGPLPEPMPPDPMFDLRLSPDGRWLIRPDNGGLLIHDLTGKTTRRVLAVMTGAWSLDGLWLVVDGTGRSVTELVEVDTGTTRPVRVPWGRIVGVLSPDAVVVARQYDLENPDPDPRRETYAIVAPSSGEILRELPVELGDDTGWFPAGAGGGVLVLTSRPGSGQVLVVSLESGRIITRHTLPAETPATFDFWHVAGLARNEVRLVRDRSVGSPSPIADPVEIHLMDLDSGQRRLVCTLPASSQVITRG